MGHDDHPDIALIDPIRVASRCMVRELGFMQATLAATDYPPSAVHALLEIDSRKRMTAAQLAELLGLEKSSISRMLRKLADADELHEQTCDEDGRVKWLQLTARGKRTVKAIHAYARERVSKTLAQLSAPQQQLVAHGLDVYAAALQAQRQGQPLLLAPSAVTVVEGYQAGALGRVTQMHAEFYHRTVGFGSYFESKVAAGLAEFAGRLAQPRNALWLAWQDGQVVGSIAIDGEDLGDNCAHLRWFIVADSVRGTGAGRRLLQAALQFCEAQAFRAVQLWTFQGLDAARRLYEAHGFALAEQWSGDQWGRAMVEQRFERVITA